MKKSFLMLVAAAGMFAACTNEDAVLEQPVAQQGETPVLFDAYAGRAVTRAGAAGEMSVDGSLGGTNKAKLTDGFGVFGYYTNNGDYDENVSTPNFMYNQKVETASWTYTPVKYWPNEYGNTAVSDETDKLTFFAYAPYVEVVPSTGKISGTADKQTWGITGLTRNTAIGDPLVKYIVNFDASKSVDLVWGTVADASAYTTWATTLGTPQSLTAGTPWKDVQRPADATGAGASAQKVKFDFKHATSKLNVQIAYYADKQTNDATEDIAATTKIYVRSITFKGFATKGALNLNNDVAGKARWMSFNGTDDLETSESVTIFDGRKDDKEGVDGAIASNEKITGLNSTIISDNTNTQEGVTKTLKNLFTATAASDPIYVIPTGDDVEVEIVYDVETEDDNLAGVLSDGTTHGSSIENRISKKITWASTEKKFENGKAYTLKLYLGMNSVKFDAAVTGWDAQAEVESDLPANKN